MKHGKIAGLLIAAAVLLGPASAFAQQTGMQQQSEAPPSYGRQAPKPDGETVHGRVLSFDGGYNLQVQDDRGFVDSVQLHQGTIINPTGITLAPGMKVTIYGVNRGSMLAANQIDTPYDTYAAVPVYPYGYGYGPYPYAYPIYPYEPRFSFGIGFGGGGFHGHRR